MCTNFRRVPNLRLASCLLGDFSKSPSTWNSTVCLCVCMYSSRFVWTLSKSQFLSYPLEIFTDCPHGQYNGSFRYWWLLVIGHVTYDVITTKNNNSFSSLIRQSIFLKFAPIVYITILYLHASFHEVPIFSSDRTAEKPTKLTKYVAFPTASF